MQHLPCFSTLKPAVTFSISGNKPVYLAMAINAALIGSANATEVCIYKAGPADASIVQASQPDAGISRAWYGKATRLYTHGVLGDSIEAHTLYAEQSGSTECALEITLGEFSVFEDINPRIADVTGDGNNNIIVIESHVDRGASLAVYGIKNGVLGKVATTPHIGTRNRWLAPVGIADFNNDGINDVAYVQTPHIGGILKIWSFKDESPRQIVSAGRYSNHRIGQNYITGGVKICNNKPTMILPNQQWSETLTVTYDGDALVDTVYADNTLPATVRQALQCP